MQFQLVLEGGWTHICILQGMQCLELNVIFDVEVTPFEFSWTLNNFKGYYDTFKKFQRRLDLTKEIQFPSNRQSDSYSANLTFKMHMPRYPSEKNFKVEAQIKVRKGREDVDLGKNKDLEYEGELIIASKRGFLSTGPESARKSSFNSEIKFEFFKKLNLTEFQNIIGNNNPVQFVFRLNQYKLPPTVGTRDVQLNCGDGRNPFYDVKGEAKYF